MERYYNLLKPGGKLITVIDDTLLSSGNFAYLRDFIRSHFLVRAIISLPGDTFRRSGSRVKTSALVLEKRQSEDDIQPNWFYFFSEYLGVDDLNPKASEQDVAEARSEAEAEADQIVDGYVQYLTGKGASNVLGPERITNRLDLRNCVPLFGRMKAKWRKQGIEVRRLDKNRHLDREHNQTNRHSLSGVYASEGILRWSLCPGEPEIRRQNQGSVYASCGHWSSCLFYYSCERWRCGYSSA